MRALLRLLPTIGLAFGAGCGSSSDESVRIQFKAVVGSQPFSCTQTYSSVGTTKTTWTPMDFRLYVHDIRLVGASGEVPVQVTDDGQWQKSGVTLLDFEDKTGGCDNGTAATNDVVVGTAPSGTYTGIHFSLGVPFAQNHQDVTSAPAPLNVSGLFWDWQSGYKFAKIEGKSTGLPTGYLIHVGSTGCDGDAKGNVTTCSNPNISDVSLTGFDPTKNTVVADLAALTATADLDHNTDMTAPGCMSFPDDPECTAIFAKLGLPYGGASASKQEFFRVQ